MTKRAASPVKTEPSVARTLARAAFILLTYGVLADLALTLTPSALAAIPILGCAFILSGFLNAGHECVHCTHIGAHPWDRIAGIFWCTPILVNFSIYGRQHLIHHRHSAIEGDTEQHIPFTSLSNYLYAQSGAGFWRSIFYRIALTFKSQFPPSINSSALQRTARRDNLAVSVWLAVCIAATLKAPGTLLIVYWLPLLFYPAFALFFSLAEHFDLAHDGGPWPRARNVHSNSVIRLFQWNANYHAVHHRQPSLPAFALRSAYFAGDGSGDPVARSYLLFHLQVTSNLLHRRRSHGRTDTTRKGEGRE